VKLLLDEMFSPDIAEALRDTGHDVEAVKGNAALEGKSDAEVLQHGRDEERTVFTNNVADFSRLHAAALASGGPGHYGIIYLPSGASRTKGDIGRIVKALEEMLANYPTDHGLRNAVDWLQT
jgi:predicted nuclease of predicted toxin-antitoxin system